MDRYDAEMQALENRKRELTSEEDRISEQKQSLLHQARAARSKAERKRLWDEADKCEVSLNALSLCRP